MDEDLKRLRFKTVLQIKEICEKYELSTTGTKAELIRRVKDLFEVKAKVKAEEEKATEDELVVESDTMVTVEDNNENNGDGAKDIADEPEKEIEFEDVVLPELDDDKIESFILDKDDASNKVTCKLCLESYDGDNHRALAKHLDGDDHMELFQNYKEKTNGHLVEVYVSCECCGREVAYPMWNYHSDTDRHCLNKLLMENKVEPLRDPYAVIQKQIDKINTLETPLCGLFFIQEVINASDIENFKISYTCSCCDIKADDNKSAEEIIEHIQTKQHIEHTGIRHHKAAWETCKKTVELYNKSKPNQAKERLAVDEFLSYKTENKELFLIQHKISTKIILGEEYETRMKAKYGKEKAVHPKLIRTRVAIEPDYKADCQDTVDFSRKPLSGLCKISERHYWFDGAVEYFCVICHEELSDVIKHCCSLSHKLKMLMENKDEKEKVFTKYKVIEGLPKTDLRKKKEKELDALVLELSEKYLDKFPRSQLQVAMKAGRLMPEFDKKRREMRQAMKRKSEVEGGPAKKRSLSSGYSSPARGAYRGRGGHESYGQFYGNNRMTSGSGRQFNQRGRVPSLLGGPSAASGGGGYHRGGNFSRGGYGHNRGRGYGNDSGSYGNNSGSYGNNRGFNSGYEDNYNEYGYSGREDSQMSHTEQAMVQRISSALAKQFINAKKSAFDRGNDGYGGGPSSGRGGRGGSYNRRY